MIRPPAVTRPDTAVPKDFPSFYPGNQGKSSLSDWILTGSLRFLLTYDSHFGKTLSSEMSNRSEMRREGCRFRSASAGLLLTPKAFASKSICEQAHAQGELTK